MTEAWNWMSRFLNYVEAVTARKNPSYILERRSTDPTSTALLSEKPDDGRIDWNNLHDILRLINACNKPYAGAFDLEGEKTIIWDAQLVEDGENFCAVPGQITTLGDGFVDVACCTGKLRIFEAEVDGRFDSPRNWIQSIRKRLT